MASDSSTVGALPPPPGVTPNFVNPESIAYRIILASVLGPVITVPLCLLRLYTKRQVLRQVTYDDYTIAVATLLALGFSILMGYQTTNGLGDHIWDVPAWKFRKFMKLGVIMGPIFYSLSTLFTKVSLSLFYLRLSPSKGFRIAVYVVMAVSVGYCLIAAFTFVWVCHPIARQWDFSITTGSCVDGTKYFLVTACINSATDLTLLILPIFVIAKLQKVSLPRRIGVTLLLATGSFVCIVSLIRVRIVVRVMQTVDSDVTRVLVSNFVATMTEMWFGIICACLPWIYTFVRTYYPAFRRRVDKSDLTTVHDPYRDCSDRTFTASHPESSPYSGDTNITLGANNDSQLKVIATSQVTAV